MATYVTASICEDCKIMFPNGAIKVEDDYKQQRKNITSVTQHLAALIVEMKSLH